MNEDGNEAKTEGESIERWRESGEVARRG